MKVLPVCKSLCLVKLPKCQTNKQKQMYSIQLGLFCQFKFMYAQWRMTFESYIKITTKGFGTTKTKGVLESD